MAGEVKKKIFDFSVLRRVLLFVKPYRASFYGSIVMAVLLAVSAPVRPYLIQLTVDKAAHPAAHVPQWLQWFLFDTDLNDTWKFIIAVTIFQVVFLIVETVVRFLFSFVTSWVGQVVVRDMRIKVFEKILGLNLRQFDQTPIGTLTTRTINDIESINDIFSDGLLPIFADLLSIIITLVTMVRR